ncbi:MAG TPA: DUF4920 domain-containing protein [Phycisphaerales bacterium]|nr:DUF4920 domain-containing protein [Phycisphaerales bacterium]HMP36937.1 DUF4920 domain-containing protein [Phycisphaerales bacterium]
MRPSTVTLARLALSATLGAALLGGCAAKDGAHDGWTRFGAAGASSEHSPTVALGSLRGDERSIAIEGTIEEVCLVKGCWIVLRDDAGRQVFVRFRDYGFFVPRNAAGHRAVLLGDARVVTVSVDQLRHFAEDAGRSPTEIAAITQPEQRLEFLADTVWIEGAGLEPPYPQRR